MRRTILAAAIAAILPFGASAQERDTTAAAPADSAFVEHGLPREVARDVAALFNAEGTLRVSGSMDIAAGREIRGDVVVLDGPLTIAGRVTGTVAAVNADVTLLPGARIDGDLIVVGGIVDGRTDQAVGGRVRLHRQAMHYRREGERMVAERGPEMEAERWWTRWNRRRTRTDRNSITLASAHTYNRVEGLPILIGPSIERNLAWGRVNLDVLGVVRTADGFRWDSDNLGHSARVEVHLGGRGGVLFGGRLFDVVDGVEEWHLSDTETGLASFFLHRDYRDYFNRHGGRGYVGLFAGRDAELTVGLSDERWASRDERDPFTLFRNGQRWRENPRMDEGKFHVLDARLRFDTRNDPDDPWSGWFIQADLERGQGRYDFVAPRTGELLAPLPALAPPGAGQRASWTRGFLDLRRFNRISPDAQLNLRVVLGGWLGGAALPLQRRFSVGGPGSLPGFDFRRQGSGDDVLTCNAGSVPAAGRPAACERVALAQVEYRSDLDIRLGAWDDDEDDEAARSVWRRGFRVETAAEWVIFADAGRGWLVGPRAGDLQYPRDELPSIGSFRTDIGAGLDLNGLGLFVAKSVSNPKERPNFFVRVRRRF